MRYEIWDKIKPIKGQDASYWKDYLKYEDNDGIFLVIDNYDNIIGVEIDRIIKSVYELSNELSTEEVAQKYITIKEQERQKSKELTLRYKETEDRIIEIVKGTVKIILESMNIELPDVLK